jgi:hypothetical protein
VERAFTGAEKKSLLHCFVTGRDFSRAGKQPYFCHHEEAFRPTRDPLFDVAGWKPARKIDNYACTLT